MDKKLFLLVLFLCFFGSSCDDESSIQEESKNPLDEMECPVLVDSSIEFIDSVQTECYSITLVNLNTIEVQGLINSFCEIRIDDQFIWANSCEQGNETIAINTLGFERDTPYCLTFNFLGDYICNGDTLSVEDTLKNQFAVFEGKLYYDICP